MRIERAGCTMCHGVYPDDHAAPPKKPPHVRLTRTRFEGLLRAIRARGANAIVYADLAAWRAGQPLAQPGVLIDFDHPVRLIWENALPLLEQYGMRANLFVNTAGIEAEAERQPDDAEREFMTWDQVGELAARGWTIGCHTVHHYKFWKLAEDDPTGGLIREELARADETIERRIGVRPRELAYTGRTWSPLGEQIARERYRFARLWLTGRPYTIGDGVTPTREATEAEVLGVDGPPEADGGPPDAARYITRATDAYRLPSMELEYLLTTEAAVERYLDGL
jgi:peptidoglycan/xylan/chitin deacetylase (PgdA/CDA1 family)